MLSVDSPYVIARPKMRLPNPEGAATIIAAMACTEYLLLAADSAVTLDDGFRSNTSKLDTLADKQLAWGYAGAEEIGIEFGDWLKAYRWTKRSEWQAFRDDAADELARLNGRKR
jgi:hypothetical protein